MAGVKGRSGGARKGAGRKTVRRAGEVFETRRRLKKRNLSNDPEDVVNAGIKGDERARKRRGRKPFVPTDQQRRLVWMCRAAGIGVEYVADMVINPTTGQPIGFETLYAHFKRELDIGHHQANLAVAGALYNNAVNNNNVTAQIFWAKTRMKWTETLNVNVKRPDQMSDEELNAALAEASADAESSGERAALAAIVAEGESSTRH